MTDQKSEQPVPRDLPDQQVQEDDALDVSVPRSDTAADTGTDADVGTDADADADADPDRRLPDADESGAGRSGEPRSGSVHPEQPVPDEPSG
ncbi:hypothetical protein [Streptomyces sp. NPDC020965]|uniref:hypothetical protein n=1 Tax=Streptomyces sp. NPDC020965 TaxID=3365105 RepID=UPI0037AC7E35